MTADKPHYLLDIQPDSNGDVTIKRYPFETIFRADEWKELTEYCIAQSGIIGQIQEAKQEEREEVLDELAQRIVGKYNGKYDNESSDIPDIPADELADIIYSLRNPQERERE